jgi:hypothetical protein
VVNAALSVFTEVPPPDQKLHSLARSLALDAKGGIALARVDALPEEGKGLKVAVVSEAAAIADAAVWQAGVRDLVRTKGADVKYTVPRPVVGDADVVPIKYNYLAGYLWMIALTLFGFGLIMYFIRQEKRGKIRKLGAEEAHAETKASEERKAAEAKEADAARSAAAPDAAEAERKPTTRIRQTYVPGYLLPKVLLGVLGLAMMVFAVREVMPNLRLVFAGAHGEAVATAVVATKPGQAEERFTTQNDLKAKTEAVGNAKDYAWEFWNEFSFELADGKEVSFRRDVACKLKPSMPLLDEGGLPTTATILYDPAKPERCCLPLEYSTWFAPFIIFMIGLGAAVVGAILAWYARKPIVLDDDVAVNPQSDTTRIQAPVGKH